MPLGSATVMGSSGRALQQDDTTQHLKSELVHVCESLNKLKCHLKTENEAGVQTPTEPGGFESRQGHHLFATYS